MKDMIVLIFGLVVFLGLLYIIIWQALHVQRLAFDNKNLKHQLIEKGIYLASAFEQMTDGQKKNMTFLCKKCNGKTKIDGIECVECKGTGIREKILNEVLMVNEDEQY